MRKRQIYFILSLLAWSFSSYAQSNFNESCIKKNDTIAPSSKTYVDSNGNTQEYPIWTAWKANHPARPGRLGRPDRPGWETSQNWACCPGLNLSGSTCKDPSMVDDTLTACSNSGECSNGTGCFELRDDDMFNTNSEDEDVIAAVQAKEDLFDQQQETLGDSDPKPNGQGCYRNMECESYKCEDFECVENKICRLADKDEIAEGAIQCEEPYTENGSAVCVDNSYNFYSLLLPGIAVEEMANQQCQFRLTSSGHTPAEVEAAANLGMVTMRSMEWLFATTSNNNHEDCLFTMRWMREKVGELLNSRKVVLNEFNQAYLKMEKEFEELKKAKIDDHTTMIKSPCGETTTGHDIATRSVTGIDYLCYMRNKNDFFIVYETAMKKYSEDMLSIVTKYRTIFNAGEKDDSWTVGDWSKNWENQNCRSSPRWHKKVKRRWGQRYRVKGEHDSNKNVIERSLVKKYLEIMGSPDDFKQRKFWLLDPLMPGGWNQGVSFENYGVGDGEKRRRLKNENGFNQIHQGFKDKLYSHFKSLKTDATLENFIYEPEIPSSFETRGCAEDQNKANCEKFSTMIERVQDVSFAQMVSYSRHHKKKYKSYFKDDNWRKKLYDRYEIDLNNMNQYYSATLELKQKQNGCYTRLIDHILSEAYDGSGQGVSTGVSNFYQPTEGSGGGSSINLPNRTNDSRPGPRVKSFNPYMMNFKNFNNRVSNLGTTGSGSGSSSSNTSSGQVNGASGVFAASLKKMLDQNKNAIAKGIDVKGRDKALRESLASSGLMSSPAAGSSSSSSMGNSSSSLKGEMGQDKSSAANGDKPTSSGDSKAFSNGPSPFGSFSNQGLGGVNSGGPSSDPTGMSDEEKDVMAKNIERNKSEYNPHEDDSLFQVVSKTYVRNIDKILNRKKKIDEDEFPGPESSKP